MSKIDWAFIRDGYEFEFLVDTLIRHKDPQAQIYERPGPDAGMDAKSKDGQTVYQAKYSKTDCFSQLLGTVKKEIEKIKKYKKSDHKNHQHWKDVKNWELVTNVTFNPTDEKKWKVQVDNPLKARGISASLQHKSHIEQDLIRFLDVKNEFFGGQNRVLQSLSEAKNTFKDNKVLDLGLKVPFKCRLDESEKFSEFIKTDNFKKVININGAGGVGKTRFVLEAAHQASEKGYDVFWANTATMESSNNWFQAIVTSRKALLIIDEPREQKSIEVLLEQMQSPRLSNWKVVIITRLVKEPILDILNHNLLKSIADPIEIKPLNSKESKEMFWSFLDSSKTLKNSLNNEAKRKLSRYISKASGGFPIWMAVVVCLLERKGSIIDTDLPQDHFGLAKEYMKELLSSPPKFLTEEIFCEYLKAIAILQPINIEDDPEMHEHFQTLLGNDINKPELEKVFKHLQGKKFTSKRGRLLEIKPDVIRDYIIFKWIGENTSESEKLFERIFQLKNSYKMQSSLVQLARVAFDDRYKGQQGKFFNAIWNLFVTEIKKGDVETQDNMLELASAVSFANPVKFLEVVKAIKENKKEKKAFENTNICLSHDDLVIKLPEAIYNAGKYVLHDEEAQQIFKELLMLFWIEHSMADSEDQSLPNNEEKSLEYIKNLMKIDEQGSRYKTIIFEWTKKELNSIHQITDESAFKLLKPIVEDFLTIKRDKIKTEGWIFFITLDVVDPELKDQEYIDYIMEEIWNQLKKPNLTPKKRVLLWQLISFYQNQLSHAEQVPLKPDQEQYRSFWEKKTKENFQDLKNYISTHNLHISEIKPLKSIWNWHLKYDKRQGIKNMAKECEDLILKDSTYQDMKPLFEGPHYYPEQSLIKKYVTKNNSMDKLRSFVDNCFHYAEQNRCQDILHRVAGVLVNNTEIPPYALGYIEKILKEAKDDQHFEFVCRILFHWAGGLRKQKKNELNSLLNKYWGQLKSAKQKELFLKIVFFRTHPVKQGLMTKQDIEFMFKIVDSNNQLSKESLYLIGSFAGRVIFFEFTQSKNLISCIFKKIELEDTFALFEYYVGGVEHRLFFKEKYPVSKTENIFLWLIELLSNKVFSKDFMSDTRFLEDNLMRIKQQLNARFFIKDYVGFLKKRLSLFKDKKIKKEFLWNNPLLENSFLKMVEPVNQKNDISQATKDAFNTLLDDNGSNILYYKLPTIVKMFDPEGLCVPKMIIKRIKDKNFLCKSLKDDTPAEYEWTRYAGSYSVNSEAWRKIALVACHIASKKTQKKEKDDIFSSLMNYDIEIYKGRPGEVPQFFYDDVERAKQDFEKEKDENVKEFMKWRWNISKKRIELEKQRIAEQEGDVS